MEENQKEKKPIYKKAWFWIIIVLVLLIIGSFYSPDEEEIIEEEENDEIEEIVEEDTIEIEETVEEKEITTDNTKSETADLNEKENNLKAILDTIYLYGYKLPLFDGGFEHINTTDTFSVYGGKIVITNAYGTKSDYSYTVRYDNDNNVEQIVVDGTSVYER